MQPVSKGESPGSVDSTPPIEAHVASILDNNKCGCVHQLHDYVLSAQPNSLCSGTILAGKLGHSTQLIIVKPGHVTLDTTAPILSLVSQDVDGGLANEQRQRRRKLHRRADHLSQRGSARILSVGTVGAMPGCAKMR